MKRLRGFAFLIAGLVLGIVGAVVSTTAIVFSSIGMVKVRRSRKELGK